MFDKSDQHRMTLDSDDEGDSLCATNNLSRYILEKDTECFFNVKDVGSINLLHINARSLKKNFVKLESLLANIKNPLSAIAISETWLNDSSTDNFFLPNYNFISKSRVDKVGGGVGIFVHSSLNYSVRSDLCRMENYIECVFLEIIQINLKSIIIGCIYRPPNADRETIDIFNSEFSQILKNIEQGKEKTVLLAGDYNLDLIKNDKHGPTADFLNNLLCHSFLPAIRYPTRISEHSSTLIDNIFINVVPERYDSAIIYNDISDHLPIAIHLKVPYFKEGITPQCNSFL